MMTPIPMSFVSLTEAHKNIEIGIIMKIKLSNNQIKLRAGLFASQKGLDKFTPFFEWKVLGEGKDDGAYNLLGFESYAKCRKFMLQFIFLASMDAGARHSFGITSSSKHKKAPVPPLYQ
jgi:hypothetical protein